MRVRWGADVRLMRGGAMRESARVMEEAGRCHLDIWSHLVVVARFVELLEHFAFKEDLVELD